MQSGHFVRVGRAFIARLNLEARRATASAHTRQRGQGAPSDIAKSRLKQQLKQQLKSSVRSFKTTGKTS